MLKSWCKVCQVQLDKCQQSETHRKEALWRVDFLIGGRFGQRIRKYFDTKELARAYESQIRTDFLRGKLMPHETQSKMPFRELAGMWLTKHAMIRTRTAGMEKYHVNVLVNFFKDRAVSQLQHKDGEEFVQYSLSRGKRPGGVNRDLHTLKSILHWAVKNRHILANPMQHLEQLKGETSRVRWLSREELSKLLESCHSVDPELADVILFGVFTGFRKGNLERVTANDVNTTFVTAVKTKSGKPYDVPISPELQQLLNKLVKVRPTGPLLNTSNLGKRFQRVVKDAGLWAGARDPNTVTLHTLRHTFASYYLKQGGDLYKLQSMLGHATVVMTQRYAHLCQKDIAAQAQLLNFGVTPSVEFKVA